MVKWWARTRTCSASLASKAHTFTLCLFGALARWSVRLHLCCALAVAATHALAAHPLGKEMLHQLFKPARRLVDKNDELQRALVLPWVLLSVAAAVLWAACAILRLGWLLGGHVCRLAKGFFEIILPCRRCGQSRSKAVTPKEEKDNGPPKTMSSAKQEITGKHLRRRTYPKITR